MLGILVTILRQRLAASISSVPEALQLFLDVSYGNASVSISVRI